MNISFYRGDDHEVKFRFKNFEGKFDDIIFAVKNLDERVIIEKHLGKGIEPIDEWFHVCIKPEDTSWISFTERMTYDVRAIIQGLEFTVQRGNFKIK